jgi:nucleoside permease NupC
MTGLKIAAGVATVVMAFVAIIALLNGIIGGIGGWFGYGHATLEGIFGFCSRRWHGLWALTGAMRRWRAA